MPCSNRPAPCRTVPSGSVQTADPTWSIRLKGARAITSGSRSTVRAIAETGVDVISVGALTHSARALDLGLDVRVRAAED